MVYDIIVFPGGASGNPPADVGDMRDMGLIPELGRSPGHYDIR